jgi:hypothetical protein
MDSIKDAFPQLLAATQGPVADSIRRYATILAARGEPLLGVDDFMRMLG